MSQVLGHVPREMHALFQVHRSNRTLPRREHCKRQHGGRLGNGTTSQPWAVRGSRVSSLAGPRGPEGQWDGVMGTHRGTGPSRPQKTSFLKVHINKIYLCMLPL